MIFMFLAFHFVLYAFVVSYCIFFFFFKQKTAYEMRISDWSSDVCSSDLHSADPDDSRLHLPRRGIAGHLRPQAEEGRVMPADKHDGILQIRDLSLAFRTPAGRLKVLRDISLDLGRGRILGIDRKRTRRNSSH